MVEIRETAGDLKLSTKTLKDSQLLKMFIYSV